jgi:hypothetical protein
VKITFNNALDIFVFENKSIQLDYGVVNLHRKKQFGRENDELMNLRYLIKKHYVKTAVAGMHYIMLIIVSFSKYNRDSTLIERNELHR